MLSLLLVSVILVRVLYYCYRNDLILYLPVVAWCCIATHRVLFLKDIMPLPLYTLLGCVIGIFLSIILNTCFFPIWTKFLDFITISQNFFFATEILSLGGGLGFGIDMGMVMDLYNLNPIMNGLCMFNYSKYDVLFSTMGYRSTGYCIFIAVLFLIMDKIYNHQGYSPVQGLEMAGITIFFPIMVTIIIGMGIDMGSLI